VYDNKRPFSMRRDFLDHIAIHVEHVLDAAEGKRQCVPVRAAVFQGWILAIPIVRRIHQATILIPILSSMAAVGTHNSRISAASIPFSEHKSTKS
jgi:hypothetical protein